MLRDCKRFSAVIALFVALSFIPLCLSDSSVCDRQSRSPAADSFTAAVCDFAGSAALVSAEEIIPANAPKLSRFNQYTPQTVVV